MAAQGAVGQLRVRMPSKEELQLCKGKGLSEIGTRVLISDSPF
ncbi:hypothetical protein HMPREF0322_02457 [Desulfitobacterium hafniense DP7]|uniref:Uncharacterized protein n=1 Tax=Desulfitobacterium hafniense DP7 TaxID=537010 RepID=G9XNB5_DESHA|nr:hypothetical protein HMPREF0322_02457 [Desulfitobacterium hafniense DP7]